PTCRSGRCSFDKTRRTTRSAMWLMNHSFSSACRHAAVHTQWTARVVDAKEVGMTKAKKAVPEGHHTVTPHLILDNAAPAIDWYKKALGALEVARAVGPDGKIMHAEIRVGDSLIMLNDEMGGGKSAKAIGGSPVCLWLYVENCDTLFNRAVSAGGKVRP